MRLDKGMMFVVLETLLSFYPVRGGGQSSELCVLNVASGVILPRGRSFLQVASRTSMRPYKLLQRTASIRPFLRSDRVRQILNPLI